MSKRKSSHLWRMLVLAMAMLTLPMVAQARNNALYPPGIGFNPLVDYDLANWGFSPNIRKFVDKLPGLGLPGCTVSSPNPGTGSCNENNLGQYIPIAQPDTAMYPGSDYYELGATKSPVKMSSDLPATPIRLYYQKNGVDHSKQYLGPAVLAQRNRPVRLKMTNELGVGLAGNLGLAVDTTLIGAGTNAIGTVYPQNRIAIHLHGGATPWISDGTPHQWFAPAGDPTGKGASFQNVPDMVTGSVVNGTAVPCIGGASCYSPTGTDGIGTYYYTNEQSSKLMFYHDHALAITRLNVYAGLAAPYILTDNYEQDLINGTNTSGANPTNAMILPGKGLGAFTYGIPLVIQDKSWVNDATTDTTTASHGFPAPETGYKHTPWTSVTDPLWYTWVGTPGGYLWEGHEYMPVENPFDPSGNTPTGRWDYGPFLIPPAAPLNLTLPSPTIIPEAFSDTAVVNGTAFPYIELPPDVVRFRILNACDSRSLNLSLFKADPLRINVTSGGTGYATVPNVTVSGPGTATATATLTSGIVTAITVTNAQGYPADSHPTVTIAAPGVGGTQATAVAVVATEVKMVDAAPNAAYPTWPVDGRDGGVPDPTTAGPPWIQIGNEGGFLGKVALVPAQPIDYEYNRQNIPAQGVTAHSLLLMDAMRADVVVDFSQYKDGDTLIVYNDAPAPMPGLWPLNDYFTDDPDQTATGGPVTTPAGFGPNTRTVMQIRIKGTKTSSFNFHSDAKPGFVRGAPTVSALPAVETPATDGASLTALKTLLPQMFAAGSDKILVPQIAYNGAYPVGDPLHYSGATDHFVRGYETTYNVMGASQTIASVLATAPGANYTTPPTVTLVGGFPAGCVAPACVAATATAGLDPIGAVTLTAAGTGYTSAPTVTLYAPAAGGVRATATATVSGGIVTNLNMLEPGSNYTNALPAPPADCTITGGGGTGATCTVQAANTNLVGSIKITNPGAGYVSQPQVFITGGAGTGAAAVARLTGDVAMTGKNITEGFDLEYGRLDIRLGSTPNPLTPNVGTGFVVGLARYVDPPTEILNDGELVLWRFSHLGVDSHSVHFHLFNLQVVNRVDWTNVIKPPYPDEIGWRDVIRTNPMEDLIVAIKPYHMTLPFPIPNSIRLLDETTIAGSTTNFYPVPPPAGVAAVPQQSNVVTDFGWEYVWHCHLLGHEENDMMRPMVFVVASALPPAPALAAAGVVSSIGKVTVTWTMAATTTANAPTGFIVERATGAASTTFTPIAKTTSGTVLTYVDSSIAPSTIYRYRVSAYNPFGTSAPSTIQNSTAVVWTNPTVSIVTPTPAQVFVAPATLNLTASVTVPTTVPATTVTKVEYYYGTTLLGTSSTTAPYTVSFPNVSAGSMTLTAKVYTSAGSTALSGPVTITVINALPTAPTAVSPTGANILISAPFTFNAVPGASSYQIWLQDNTANAGAPTTFTSGQAGCPAGTGTCSYTMAAPLVVGHNYAWIVAGQNLLGQGPWSSALNFSAGSIPAAPSIIGPSNNGITTTPSFTLNATPGITGYMIWLQDMTANAGAPNSFTTAQGGAGCNVVNGICSFSMASPLVSGHDYAWVAAAQNGLGQGPWSSPLSFFVGTLAAPSITSPTGGPIASPPVFSVSAVAGAFNYVVWLQNNTTNSGAPLIFTAAQGGVGCTFPGTCNFTGPALVSGNSYSWVAAGQSSAATGPYSTPLSFTAL